MRLVTFEGQGGARLGAVIDNRVVDLEQLSRRDGGRPLPADMLGFLDEADANLERARELLARIGPDEGHPLSEVRLLAPIPRPRQNVIAVGLNYVSQVAEAFRARGETTVTLPEHPVFFTKRPRSVIGPDAPIGWDPTATAGIDWEGEMAVVLGRRGKNISPDRVRDYVFGYTCANDITARDLQKRHSPQWFKGKSLDDCCPLGPWIVTSDELPDVTDLRITCRVNGQVKQDDRTSTMVFDVPTIVSELSAGLTVEPGDIIVTGCPSGVGFVRNPPEFLRPGDVVEVEVEGIGVLRNGVVMADQD